MDYLKFKQLLSLKREICGLWYDFSFEVLTMKFIRKARSRMDECKIAEKDEI